MELRSRRWVPLRLLAISGLVIGFGAWAHIKGGGRPRVVGTGSRTCCDLAPVPPDHVGQAENHGQDHEPDPDRPRGVEQRGDSQHPQRAADRGGRARSAPARRRVTPGGPATAGGRPSCAGPLGRALWRRHSVPTQFSSNRAPASPDFSGWNWVATNGPFSTAATNDDPCSDQLTLGVITAMLPSGSSCHLSAA